MNSLEKQIIKIEELFKKNKESIELTLIHKNCYIPEETLEFLAEKYKYKLIEEKIKSKETIYIWRKEK